MPSRRTHDRASRVLDALARETFNACVVHGRQSGVRDPKGLADQFVIDEAPVRLSRDERLRVGETLDLLIDAELKLLAANEGRQANADARITALATAAVALPPLTLSLSNASSASLLFQLAYGAVVVAAIVIMGLRVWSGWRWRRRAWAGSSNGREPAAKDLQPQPLVSVASPSTWEARRRWRDYQRETRVVDADPVRVRQLALCVWRARVDDSHRDAQTKDKMAVFAATLLAFALLISVVLVFQADFTQ